MHTRKIYLAYGLICLVDRRFYRIAQAGDA
jgi:hypothetical protein